MIVNCSSCGSYVDDVSPLLFSQWLAQNAENSLKCGKCDPLVDCVPVVLAGIDDLPLVIREDGKKIVIVG